MKPNTVAQQKKASLTIGIDVRPLSYRLTGIGYYLKHLLDAMQVAKSPHRFFLISNTVIDYEVTNPRWQKVEGGLAKKLTSTLWMQTRVPLLALRLKLDIFWSPRHHLPLLLPPRTRCVVTIHDIVHRRYPETMSRANLLVERLLMNASIRRARTIITDALSTRSDLQSWYGINKDKIRVIYPGVPPLPDHLPEDAGNAMDFPDKFILFVGTLDPRKNFEGLFRAFEMMEPQQYGLHLVIAGGSGWKNSVFFEKLTQSPLRGYVRLTGYLTRPRLAELYRRAVCLVLPSYYEGFGFPILEAMAMGTPVVTSTVSSLPEVAGDAALLVDPGDIQGLSNAVLSLVCDPKLRNRLIQAGKQRTRTFSWSDCARETMQTFERLGES